MIGKSNAKNISEVIGELVSGFINEQEQEQEQIEQEVKRSSRLLITTAALSVVAIVAAIIVIPDEYKNFSTNVQPTIIQSELVPLRKIFERDYNSMKELIVKEDYELARKELIEENASIEQNYTRCNEQVCTQTILTNQLKVNFVRHKDKMLYITASKL